MHNRDVRIGVCLVLTVVVAACLWVAHGRRQGVRFQVEFDDGGNLKPGDAAYMQGVDIGEIEDVELLQTRKVRVHVRLAERFASLVPGDGTFVIVNDKFIFGKKALLVIPPPGQRPPVAEGQVVKGLEGYTELYLRRGSQKVDALWQKLKGWLNPDESSPSAAPTSTTTR